MKPPSKEMQRAYSACYATSVSVHNGQLYGDNKPYFNAHVWPLADFFRKRGMWDEACLSLLRDTVEDHPDKVTYARLTIIGVPTHIRAALRCITKERGEVYATYLERVMSNELAWRVKLRDVLLNISAPGNSKRRLLKYAHALQVLIPDAPDSVIT